MNGLSLTFRPALERAHADRAARLSRRRADDPQPLHPAGAAVRVRPRRPAASRAAACRCCSAWRSRSRSSRRWRRSAAAGRCRRTSTAARSRCVLLALFGLTLLFPQLSDRAHAPAGRAGRTAVGTADGDGELRSGPSAAPRRRHRPAVGAVRGADPRPHADRRGAAGRERRHDACCCSPMRSARRPRWRWRCWSAARSSRDESARSAPANGCAARSACWCSRGVAAIALGLDTGPARSCRLASTASLESRICSKARPAAGDEQADQRSGAGAASCRSKARCRRSPALGPGSTAPPLTREQLRGKVVLVDFWTYSCINCMRSMPYVRAWADKYKDHGLVVIGVHAPEFAFEKEPGQRPQGGRTTRHRISGRARQRLRRSGRASTTTTGRRTTSSTRRDGMRHHHFGEGGYEESEMVIRQLLAEAGRAPKAGGMARGDRAGAEAAAATAASARPKPMSATTGRSISSRPAGSARDAAKNYAAARSQLNTGRSRATGRWHGKARS